MGSIGARREVGGNTVEREESNFINTTTLTPAQAMQMYIDAYENGEDISNEVIQTVNKAVNNAKWKGDKFYSELEIEGVGRAIVRKPKDPDENQYIVTVYGASGYPIGSDRTYKISDAKKYAKDALKIE